MTEVTAQLPVSLDGCHAGPRDPDGVNWLESRRPPGSAGDPLGGRRDVPAPAAGLSGGEEDTNSRIVAETCDAAAAHVPERRMADGGEVPWSSGGAGPATMG